MDAKSMNKLLEIGLQLKNTTIGDIEIVENLAPTEYLNSIGVENDQEVTLNYFVSRMVCYHLGPGEDKNDMLRTIGVDIGEDVIIAPNTLIDPIFPDKITIKDDAVIGWGANLFTHMYNKEKEITKGEIIVGEGAYVGGFSTVHPGVTVEGVLYNHSVANKDIPKGEEWGGIPAEKIKKVDTS